MRAPHPRSAELRWVEEARVFIQTVRLREKGKKKKKKKGGMGATGPRDAEWGRMRGAELSARGRQSAGGKPQQVPRGSGARRGGGRPRRNFLP